MNHWEKQLGLGRRFYDGVLAAVIFTGLVGFILNQPIFYFPTGLLIIFILGSKIFDHYSGSDFELQNAKRSVRLFPGDETEWKIHMNNYSRVPMLNGTLSFETGKMVSSRREMMNELNHSYSFKLPFSLMRRGESIVHIPVRAEKRGVTKARNMSFRFPHLLNFTPIKMRYKKPYQTEFIVYPTPEPVLGVKEFIHPSIGEQRANFSPYEDVLTPVGTRDYEQGDAFHKIHWKASAKSQSLKTKVLERQVDGSWTIIVNVVEQTRLGNEHLSPRLESLLSYACYLCYTATERGYPYEMIINMRKPQRNPYFYQEKGEGSVHLRHSLEMLARIDKEQRLLPMDQLFHWFGSRGLSSKVVLIVGEIPDGTVDKLKDWQSRGAVVLQVQMDGSSAYLRPALQRGGA
ncbi:DUF58 domain-containing protein [Halobacillus aidingensis]|uniref:Uncharacterized conserved protein, DUF58 family, contains vWF domain n=1 Tax=Halobacillus aidingensis TaxID=240303 RepID=A0A1H0TBL1_HALAD|nr:DUF58 domain-containing protein [Halobacillus aidingensis]SDP51201.1 Uncharacterized conserved protein, DUF58 family, contains vWF domain [Halobacillus aidingensis]